MIAIKDKPDLNEKDKVCDTISTPTDPISNKMLITRLYLFFSKIETVELNEELTNRIANKGVNIFAYSPVTRQVSPKTNAKTSSTEK